MSSMVGRRMTGQPTNLAVFEHTTPTVPRRSSVTEVRRRDYRSGRASALARSKTSSSIRSVNRPVKVFCWLTW